MEISIISAALFIVMILLLLVVYDSNATMQAIVGKIRKSRKKDAGESHQEVIMAEEQIAGMIDQQVSGMEVQQPIAVEVPQPTMVESQQPQSQQVSGQQVQVTGYQETIDVPSDDYVVRIVKSVGVKEWYMGAIKKLFRKANKKETKRENRVERPVQAETVPQESTSPVISNLQDAIADLTYRVMQAEAAMGKIGQLEGDITKTGEETEMVAEEMRDILGTIRISIDGLDGKINQVSSEVQQLQESKDNELETQATTLADVAVDEETKQKIKRLQEAVADMTDTIEAMPEEIRTAVTNSQSAIIASQGNSERLEIIWDNLQSTPGFGARKTFRCESCGSHGYIASQVSCSKCGTSSWFGWWPSYEEMQEMEANATAHSHDSTEQEEITEMAEMFGSDESVAEVAEVQDLPDIDENPEIPDIDELAKMIEDAGIANETEETESMESVELPETTEVLESVDTAEVEEAPKPKAKPKRTTKKAKKK
ncbi:MAG: hypothetical protein HQ553_00940 [Chloroflexi bacterium]|nr:hypothetical protein [Chloroflexota bacterium]